MSQIKIRDQINFQFLPDNDHKTANYDSNKINTPGSKENSVPRSNGVLRGTTKKIIQVASDEDFKQNLLTASKSNIDIEEQPSIISDSKIKPSEFRNKLKQEIEKLHHQQEKITNQNNNTFEPNNSKVINTQVETEQYVNKEGALLHDSNENIRTKLHDVPTESKIKVLDTSENTNNAKLSEIFNEKILRPRRVIKSLSNHIHTEKIEKTNEKFLDSKREIHHFGRPVNIKQSREHNKSQIKKECENLKLPSIMKNREKLNMSTDLNGYKRCPCLMHNRLYYQEYKKCYLETDFCMHDYWNEQYEIIFNNQKNNNTQPERLRCESLNRFKLFKKTPWNPAF